MRPWLSESSLCLSRNGILSEKSNMKILALYGILGISKVLRPEQNQLVFRFKVPLLLKKLPIETLLEKIKLVLTKKKQFDCRTDSAIQAPGCHIFGSKIEQ